jgi:hypothetical protein
MLPSSNSAPASLEAALLAKLEERLRVVADREFYQRDAVGHLAELQRVSEELAELVRHLPPQLDPMLRHYLERQSYVKAIEFLRARHKAP